MCYITESAIDHELSRTRSHRYKCDNCERKTDELTDIEYVTVQEDMVAQMEDREIEPTHRESVCADCYEKYKENTNIILY